MNREPVKAQPSLRCAIYTRKSSEEGLEQGFNSLHAQREACEAYVLSQAGEGWSALPAIYDDGGWSGGNMERPGLQRLLADVAARKVDVVVVYKVDRLTRALADFAKIVEIFDASSVSFVSVTQAFNTTTSMGRLTLNVLLSFAQFEREVTGERIRDKIAASKAKGMWMGGSPPLGYDPPAPGGERTLVLVPAEAETVRLIFIKYLELRSVHALQRWLADENLTSKLRTTRAGKTVGGVPFNRGALFHLLKNRTYLGEVIHKDVSHPARHPAILDRETFEAVQALLATQGTIRRERPTRAVAAVLKGKIFDAEGEAISPSFTHRGHRVHRYYVSAPLQRGASAKDDLALRRVPAQPLETLVLDRLQAIGHGSRGDGWDVVASRLRRVEVHATTIQLLVSPLKGSGDLPSALDEVRACLAPGERAELDQVEPTLMRIVLPVRLKLRGGRTWLVSPSGAATPTTFRIDKTLVRGLKAAHRLMDDHHLRPTADFDFLQAKAPGTAYERSLLRLALLAPDIQAAILEGRQSTGLTLQFLLRQDLPLAWTDQRRQLGFG